MERMRKIGLYCFALLTTYVTYAQQTYQVIDDEQGKPLVGATVAIVGANGQRGGISVTDTDGRFSTGLPSPLTIEVRHLGYQTRRLNIIDTTEPIVLSALTNRLDEVVVTGQFEAQSIDRSVHTVKAINRERIEAQGAVDLADVLSNILNITLTPDKGSGRTGISMLGLDGQYVKILLDGIPVPSVNGNGNNVDITQINMNSIERVEIVEGPMAVSYGANAAAGVINLISKITPTNSIAIQEETVGNEYGLSSGRHIQNINLGTRLGDQFTLLADYQRNDFQGFRNGFQGAEYTENNGQRGFDWHPKEQHSASATLGFRSDQARINYRFAYFTQRLEMYSRIVFPDEHPFSGISNPFALDDRNQTNRWGHHLSAQGKIGQINYHVVSSFTGVEATQSTYRHRIETGAEEEVINEETSLLNSFTSRGIINNFTEEDLDFELGYEYTWEKVDGANIEEGTQSIGNIAGFASLEWSPLETLTFRPGMRTIYNSLYSAPIIYSMNMKYRTPFNMDVRVAFGRSYRTPNVTELYFYFVDANHDVQGNANLNPEDGHGISIDLKQHLYLGEAVGFTTLKVFRNDIQNQIALAVVNQAPLRFQYINIDRFKSKGVSFSNRFEFANLAVNAGISYIGRFNQLSEDEESLDDFLFSTEVNLNATYTFTKPNVSLALFYKHTGPVNQYVLDDESGEFRQGTTDSFNWLDFTTTWNLSDHIQFRGGIRNIMNITDVNTTSGEAGAHSDAPTAVGLTYGRSYLLRAAYTF